MYVASCLILKNWVTKLIRFDILADTEDKLRNVTVSTQVHIERRKTVNYYFEPDSPWVELEFTYFSDLGISRDSVVSTMPSRIYFL